MQSLTCLLRKRVHTLTTAQFQHQTPIRNDGRLSIQRQIGLVSPKSYNLQFLRADEENFLVRHPGLTFCDYDLHGHPQPGIIAHIVYSLVRFLHIHPLSHKKIPFTDPNVIGRDSIVFAVAVEMKFEKCIYDEKVSKVPLHLLYYPGYIGKTSFCVCTDILNDSKEELATVTSRMVIFDKGTNISKQTPMHWRRKYNNVERKPLVVDEFEVPDVTASYKTIVPFTEMGVSKTMRVYYYFKHVTDAMHHCVQTKQIDGTNEDIFKDGIKRIVTRHVKPVRGGDVIDVKMWPDQHHKKVLYFEIQSNDRSICQSCVELY